MSEKSTATKSQRLLSCQKLHKIYRMGGQSLEVLRGVDLSVKEGEWLAVLGASGSGKSTLLHLLGGLDRPNQGNVQFRGRDVFAGGSRAVDRYRNHDVGFVFQFYHLLPELSALENVLVASMVRRNLFNWLNEKSQLRGRGLQILERLGLSQRLNHRPAKLSGGERQRVAIGRALINQPAILLADEPTGNLDRETGDQILDVFSEFHRAGQTIVMVTHDARVAARADRRLTLEAGRLKDV
jgi:ABC-type lipoprotein export system ATPase subunit